jgi:putative redox protein
MASTTIDLNWKKDMAFDAEVNGHIIPLDADERVGGKDQGPRPKPLILVALAGCTGMDVVSILNKMRVVPEDLNVNVTGELTDEHPKYFNKIHIIYNFKGKNLDFDKLDKAVTLSQDRYCGVTAMLNKVAEITYEINIEE